MVLKQKKFAVPSGTTFRTGSQSYRTNYLKQATLVKTYRNSEDSHSDDDLQPDIEYSLNKKGRWNLPEQIREEFHDSDQKISLRQFHKIKRKARCVSYEANKGPVLEVSPRKHYFDVGSMEPKKSKKNAEKKSKKKANEEEIVIEDPEPQAEVVYSIYLPAGPRSAITYNPKYIDVPVYANEEDDHIQTAITKKGRPTKNRVKRIDDYDFIEDSDWSTEEESFVDDFEISERLAGATSSDYWDLSENIDGFIDIALQKKEFERYAKIKKAKKDSEIAILDVKDRKVYIDSPTLSRENSAGFIEPEFPVLPSTISVNLSLDETSEQNLVEKFGVTYAEAGTVPRRFAVDVSEMVQKVVSDDVTCYLAFEETGADVNTYRVWVQSTIPCVLRQPTLDTSDDVNAPCVLMDDVINLVCEAHKPEPEPKHEIAKIKRSRRKKIPIEMPFVEKRRTQFDASMNPLISRPVTFTNLKQACGWHVQTTDPTTIATHQTATATASAACANTTRPLVLDEESACTVCFECEESELCCMTLCGHMVCRQCWICYVDSVLRTGAGKVSCPAYECDAELSDAFIQTLVKPDLYRRYQTVKLDNFLATNKWSWCPNMCGRVVKTEAKGTSGRYMNVDCECRLNVCNDCKDPSHWPASCEQATNYRQMLKDRGDDIVRTFMPSVLVRYITCPNCYRAVEKVVGCSYVHCICDKAFCWTCGRDWEKHSEEEEDCIGINRKEAELEYIPPPGTPGNGPAPYMQAVHHHNNLDRQSRVNTAKLFNKLIKRAMNSVRKISTTNNKVTYSSQIIHDTKTDLQELEESALQVLNELHHCVEYTTVALLFRKPRTLPHQKFVDQILDKIHFITLRFHQLLQTDERPPSEIIGHLRNYTEIGRSSIAQLVSALRLNGLA